MEVAIPVVDGILRDRLSSEVLGISLADNVKARLLQPDGNYLRASPGPRHKARRSQFEFIRLAVDEPNSNRPRGRGQTSYPRVKLAPRPPGLARRKP